jgi:uncharacterized protein YbjT (DUF2867 family)
MILVTGAGGFVGSRLLRALEGREVRGMVRDAARAGRPPAGAVLAEGDVTRSETLAQALEGVTTVVHCAAITGDRKEPYQRAYDAVNRRGTEQLMDAAAKAGVARVVLLSGLGTTEAPEGTYMATRWGMEEAVRGSGIAHVILQPSVLFGRGAPFVGGLAGVVRAFPIVPVLGAHRFQPLWVDDLVRCLVQAVDDPSHDGEALPLGGPEQLTMREILEAIAGALDVRRSFVPLPLGLAALQAEVMTAILDRPPLTPAAIELFRFDNTTAPDAVERAFGFAPRPFRRHLREHGLDG